MFFVNLNTNFVIWLIKFLNLGLLFSFFFKFDAELFNLHISLSCILKNPLKYFRFDLKIWHFDIQVYFVKFMFAVTCISGHCHIKKMTYI